MTTLLDRVIHPGERVALFIDGANLYSAAKGLHLDMDYKKLLEEFRKRCKLVRAYYYTALVEEQDFSPIRPLVDWLDYNGYSVITKPAKEYTDATGRRRWKGDMDVEIAVDMLMLRPYIDHAFLFSGDGDFVRAVEVVQSQGVRVSAVSTIKSNPPMASDDLRRQVDNFLDLVDLAGLVARPPRERAHADDRYDSDEDQ